MSTKSKPEKNKLLNHDYDGIQELDNPLPRWWVWLFAITLLFGAIYFIYDTFGYGPSSAERLSTELEQLRREETESPPISDGATFSATAENLASGKKIYTAKCAACHGPTGGGSVGPNLTDAYWINGNGSNPTIANIIKKGVPEKGMIAWDSLLSNKDIEAVTVYIASLNGTNPKNALGPQGQLVE